MMHHWGGEKAALGFGVDRFRSLVSMTTDSSKIVIIRKTMSPLIVGCFSSHLFILVGNEDMHEISDEFEIRSYRTTDSGVSCPF